MLFVCTLRLHSLNDELFNDDLIILMTSPSDLPVSLLISSKVILKLLEENNVVIIPGFQGINSEGRVTTLGRGGSDTSAVAIAAAIKADFCDIYTDVDGVYTTDPNKVPDAKRLDKISYEEMLEMASLGAKVLQKRNIGLF